MHSNDTAHPNDLSVLIPRIAMLAALYFVMGRLGLFMAAQPGYATIVWPPSGIAMGFILAYGFRMWPGVFIGSFFVNLSLQGGPFVAINQIDWGTILPAASVGAGSTLQSLVGLFLVRRVFGMAPPKIHTARQGLLLFFLCGPLACLTASSIAVTTLYSFGQLPANLVFENWYTWWLGDLLGVFVFLPLVLLFINEFREIRKYREGLKPLSALIIMTVIVPLIVTFYAWKTASTFIYENNKWQFVNMTAESERALLHRIESYSHVLVGGSGFFGGSEDVSRDEWETFVGTLDIENNFPGIGGIGYIEYVPEGHMAEFLTHVRKTNPDFSVHPPGPQSGNFIITYIEPRTKNAEAFGLNVSFEKKRYEAAIKARDTGKPTMTRSIELVQDKNRAPGFLLLQAIYKKGDELHDTVEERRANLVGWIYAPFVGKEFFDGLTYSQSSTMNIRVYDGMDTQDKNLIYSSVPQNGNHPPMFTTQRTIDIMQQKWTLVWESAPAYERATYSPTPTMILVGGMIFSGLYAAFLFNLLNRTKIIESLVREKTQEAERQKEEAIKAASAKADFLAKMSHEIRTPMNGVLGFIDILQDTPMDTEQRAYLEKAKIAGNTLLRVIGDILDLSRIESGKIDIDSAPFNIRTALSLCIDLVQARAQEKNLILDCVVSARCPPVLVGDKYRIKQIAINLLANAVKFTEEGTIILRVDYANGNLLMEFEDTGIGIAKDKLDDVFENFVQEETGMMRRYGGSGLGLSITRQLVQVMGGTVRVESEKGRGSRFFVTLPMAVGQQRENNFSTARLSTSIKPKNILAVEDTPLNRDLMDALLRRAGHKVTHAENGQEAIDMLKQRHDFDLILMDIQMPVMDGLEATRIIREELDLDLPIIALTAHALPKIAQSFYDAGMDDYLIKPFDADMLYKKIDAVCGLCDRMASNHNGIKDANDNDVLFDPAKLANLRGFLGDEQTGKMVEAFRSDADERLGSLSGLEGDRKSAYQSLHALAATAGSVGLDRLSHMSRDLMDKIEEMPDDEYRDAVTGLNAAYNDALNQLNDAVGRLRA
ncbi:CHASE domain-containing protein [Micavibrio aeruginosavorus]|uniref:CHASE domain-containing protein n=1 Tax=Micavibrio aeruginosavorus TaxID=349221 RepID=UPI003F4A95F7